MDDYWKLFHYGVEKYNPDKEIGIREYTDCIYIHLKAIYILLKIYQKISYL